MTNAQQGIQKNGESAPESLAEQGEEFTPTYAPFSAHTMLYPRKDVLPRVFFWFELVS